MLGELKPTFVTAYDRMKANIIKRKLSQANFIILFLMSNYLFKENAKQLNLVKINYNSPIEYL